MKEWSSYSYIFILGIPILLFVFLCLFTQYLYQQQVMVEQWKQLGNMARKEGDRWIHGTNKEAFLQKNGMTYYVGKKITPIMYSVFQCCLASIMFMALLGEHVVYAGIGALVAYYLLDLWILYKNKQYNAGLTKDLKLVYSTLTVQIQSGLQIMDAVTGVYECLEGENNRLRDGLLDLSSNLIIYGDTELALEEFQGKFDNRYIDTLCLILKQALESGMSVDLLSDVSEQLKDMEVAILIRKKSGLDRSLTLYQMGIMIAILGVVIYASMSHMLVSLNF